MKIAVSFLKSNVDLKSTLKKIENTDADFIHVDIMDGKFVPEKTNDASFFYNNLKDIKKTLDIHLMVENPKEYIDVLRNLNPEFITIHSEIEKSESLIDLIHSYGIKAGLAINPNTRVGNITYLDKLDYVLVMGVNPGLGGQKMIMDTTLKLEVLSKLRKDHNYKYLISFDGGVNLETRKFLDYSDILVSGSFICISDDYQERINLLR